MTKKLNLINLISIGWLISLADLSAQRLCRNNATGFVRWVSGNNCPSGFSAINNSVKSNDLKANSVTTSKIGSGAVTNAKINVNTAGVLPYQAYISKIDLDSAANGYFAITGIQGSVVSAPTDISFNNSALNCTSGTIKVALDNAPGGSTDSRTFELKDGTNTISGSTLALTGPQKNGMVNIPSIPGNAQLVLYTSSSGSPAPTWATVEFICK